MNQDNLQPSTSDPSGEPATDFIVIGRILRPHGVKGELRAEIHSHLPERFTWLDQVFLSRDSQPDNPEAVAVEAVRFHKGYVLLTLDGYDNRDAAEMLRSMWLLVPETEAVPLEEGELYFFQLEGLDVYTETDEYLGEVKEVLETGANEVFIVQGPRGEVLLPNTEEVIVDVDEDAGRMTVHLIPGLLP